MNSVGFSEKTVNSGSRKLNDRRFCICIEQKNLNTANSLLSFDKCNELRTAFTLIIYGLTECETSTKRIDYVRHTICLTLLYHAKFR